jgi:hypothetical protein
LLIRFACFRPILKIDLYLWQNLADFSKLLLKINLPVALSPSWQNVTTFSNQAVNQVRKTTQKAKESFGVSIN